MQETVFSNNADIKYISNNSDIKHDFNKIYYKIKRAVKYYTWSWAEQDRQDLVQNVAIAAYKNIDDLLKEDGNINQIYLSKIFRTRASAYVKKEKKHHKNKLSSGVDESAGDEQADYDEDDDGGHLSYPIDPLAFLECDDTHRVIVEFCEKMSPGLRKDVLGCLLAGITDSESIAATLGREVKPVSQALSFVRKNLRRALEEAGLS